MPVALIEPHYLPSLEYFCAIQPFDKLLLEKHEHYVKQSYRNRCYINTAHGIERLVVPLAGRRGKVCFKDIRIDRNVKWKNNQWRTIQSAYAKAPYFEHYSDELHAVIYSDFEFLFDLNLTLLSFCLRNLGTEKEISETVTYETEPAKDIFDLRSMVSFREGASGQHFYHPEPYVQVFGNSFAGNLSIIDLLFCEGPGSVRVLKASLKKNLNK